MNYEYGYTPENLRSLIKNEGLTQKEVYEFLGKSRAVFSKYLLPVTAPHFVSMHHRDWNALVEHYCTHGKSLSKNSEKIFSYQELTKETTALIREEIESMMKLRTNDLSDSRIQRHQDTAAGAYYLWLRLTAGYQQEGDNDRLISITFPDLQ